jgi:hypothetical protein
MDKHRTSRHGVGTMFMQFRRYAALVLSLLVAWQQVLPVSAQEGHAQLQIADIETAFFPEITFHLVALDAENRVLLDMSDLSLQEDGRSIVDYEVEPIDVGVDLYVVIDADTEIEHRDEAEGLTRREKVRDSIIRYANLYMDPFQLDKVTIIVPEGDHGRILEKADLSFPNEVINAVNFYETGELEEPALNDLLHMALEQATATSDEGRFQAILLFSDAGQLDEQLEFETLVEAARGGEVAIYTAILGSRADAEEIEQVMRLTEPTGGAYAHMPNPTRTDELYEAIQQRATEAKISYRSSLDSSGVHTLAAEMAGSRAEETFELDVEPPVVHLAIDNSRPIRRVAPEPNIPFEEMEPTHQPLVAEVGWPDNYPRIMESTILLVNGQEMPVENIILGDDGLLTFEWDIRFLEEGIYDLQVQVTDELGLQGISQALPLAIEIDRVEIMPTEPPPTAPPPEPTLQPTPEASSLPIGAIAIGGGVLLLLFFLVALVVGLILWRGRRKAAGVGIAQPVAPLPSVSIDPMTAGAQSVPQIDPAVTYAVPPEFAAAEVAGAYLEVLENAPEYTTLIPVSGNNIALGRDAKRAQVAFDDGSVSRLHARIMESRGVYRIYDEGSSSGTYVNYGRISLSSQILKDKDDIHLGRVHLRFHLASSMRSGPTSDSDTQIFDSPR